MIIIVKNSLPDKDTVSLNLLELIAISGELPTHLLSRIAGSNSYKETVVTALKRQGFVKTYYKDSLRGLRLTYNAKQKLLKANPERFEFFLTGNSDTNHIKGDLARRQRLHRIAEATVTIQKPIYPFFAMISQMCSRPALMKAQPLKLHLPLFITPVKSKRLAQPL